MMRDAESHAADDVKKREEIEARNKLDGLTYQMEKTLNDNREKVGAVAGEVETAIAEAKKALAEGGVDRLNEAFNQLQAASHKMAEALYQQTGATGGETPADEQASAAGASTAGGAADDNVIDAEYVDVDENK
jgi:molecular chaperone DnaK